MTVELGLMKWGSPARSGMPLILALTLMLSGCTYGHEIAYWPLGRTVEIDPATGDKIITQFWKYSDGETTATFKRIPRGNTDTRADAPPPAGRFTD
jgi:hypothetical protein